MKKITLVEFEFDDGVHICWRKEAKEKLWTVTRFQNGEPHKFARTLGQLPSLANARYFDQKLSD